MQRCKSPRLGVTLQRDLSNLQYFWPDKAGPELLGTKNQKCAHALFFKNGRHKIARKVAGGVKHCANVLQVAVIR